MADCGFTGKACEHACPEDYCYESCVVKVRFHNASLSDYDEESKYVTESDARLSSGWETDPETVVSTADPTPPEQQPTVPSQCCNCGCYSVGRCTICGILD